MQTAPTIPTRLKTGTRVEVRSCDAQFRERWVPGRVIRDRYRAEWMVAHLADPARTAHPNALPMVVCEDDPMSGGGRWPIALVRVVDNRQGR